MNKNVWMLIIAVILILGLFCWNLYLIDQVKDLREVKEELELKNQILEGDNDVLTYDLVTSRDSLRILNKRIKIER